MLKKVYCLTKKASTEILNNNTYDLYIYIYIEREKK